MNALTVFLFVCISTLLAAYEINVFLVLFADLVYSRQVQLMRQNFLMSSSRTLVWRRRRRRRERAARRYWIRPGSTRSWWDNFVSNVVPPEEWKENFHMSRCTFQGLCHQLEPFLERQSTVMREPIEVDCQVALTLYYLADES